jgi:CCR4-NOT transcription complex subunit 10
VACVQSVLLNNMGCIHYQMGQRKAAQSYFARALQATTKATKMDAVVIASSSHHEIMYNNGLHLLLQGEYALAFRCFHESSRLFFNRPKLWLRLGECCTAAFAKEQKLAVVAGNKSGLIQGIVGSGSHRRVLLPTSLPSAASQDIKLPEKNGNGNGSRSASSEANEDGSPTMNLPFGAKCFKNVVLLCSQLLASGTENGSAEGSAPVAAGEAADGDVQDAEALDVLRQKALVNLSYVYLSMFEPQLAITSAKELLALPTCSKANSFLARSYTAEALCMLSRAPEATEALQSERDLIAMAEEYAREAEMQVRSGCRSVWLRCAGTDRRGVFSTFVAAGLTSPSWSPREQCDDASASGPELGSRGERDARCEGKPQLPRVAGAAGLRAAEEGRHEEGASRAERSTGGAVSCSAPADSASSQQSR